MLSSYDLKESNCLYTLLTCDLGLIRAQAQGVRLLKSRLRYALEPYSFAEISLVRGKDIWRITSASFQRNIYSDLERDSRRLSVLLNVTSLIKRLIQGELPDPHLFTVIKEGFHTLVNVDLGPENIADLEVLIVLRILYVLGYIGSENGVHEVAKTNNFETSDFKTAKLLRSQILRTINSSLKETDL